MPIRRLVRARRFVPKFRRVRRFLPKLRRTRFASAVRRPYRRRLFRR